MLEFILIMVAWFVAGYFGARLLMRKGHTGDGLNAIREQQFVRGQVTEVTENAHGILGPVSSTPLFVVGGPFTLLIGLLIRPKKLHAPQ